MGLMRTEYLSNLAGALRAVVDLRYLGFDAT
jgi:hypothetical protein